MKLRFIYNPCSGKNRRNPWLLEELRRCCARNDIVAALSITERPGHATELALRALAEGCTHVVAVGGDGTMNETAQALVGSEATLGLVPCGSGNGLALHLGIPTQPLDALRLLFDGNATDVCIDTGRADGHPFFNAMGIGLDAEISRRFNLLQRRGLPSYVRTTLGALCRHRPLDITVTDASGSSLRTRAMLAAVANSDQYGNMALIAPGARVDDGLLDLVILQPVGLPGAIQAAYRLFNGTLDSFSRVKRMRSSSFVMERPSPGPIHTDGETRQAGTRIAVAVRPRSLRIVVPATSAARSATAPTVTDPGPISTCPHHG
ncbi:MAG: diacylglycerol kinase family protein [Opitutaceae bacterium]|jgi:YegS/Rv2252/BmrU family lipid kinase